MVTREVVVDRFSVRSADGRVFDVSEIQEMIAAGHHGDPDAEVAGLKRFETAQDTRSIGAHRKTSKSCPCVSQLFVFRPRPQRASPKGSGRCLSGVSSGL